MNKKIAVFISLRVIIFILPLVTIILCFLNSGKAGRWFFTVFIIFFIFERSWEAFYTSKRHVQIINAIDPTLLASLFLYILLVCFCFAEFYLTNQKINMIVSVLGISIYIGALILRLLAITFLGDQWSINILDKSTTNFHKELVTKGPYKYIRHPIYLGIILEQGSVPLIFNLYYSVFLIMALSIPFHIIKAKIEEQNLMLESGISYEEYAKRTPRFNFTYTMINKKGRKSNEKSGLGSTL